MIKNFNKHAIFLLISVILLTLTIISTFYFLKTPELVLTKTNFNQLSHWEEADLQPAFYAFQQSCEEIIKRPASQAFSTLPHSGQVADWKNICLAAEKLHPTHSAAIRIFFESYFQPYRVRQYLHTTGLFTGYYLPVIQGRLSPDKQHAIPIYGKPRDLITVKLDAFHPELAGKTLIGQLKNNTLIPYPDRAAIHHGALKNIAPILAWTDNAIDLFFAQIQGSAVIEFPHHQQALLHYDGQNGHDYIPIGKILISQHQLTKENLSMQTIRTWLAEHPTEVDALLNQNPSYIFFSLSKNNAVLGAENVPLTPRASLAVDTHYIPLGAPLWLDTTLPTQKTFQNLLIAQDTGGGIKGIIRGDIYWGTGKEAEFFAGHMQQTGEYWIFLPKKSLNA